GGDEPERLIFRIHLMIHPADDSSEGCVENISVRQGIDDGQIIQWVGAGHFTHITGKPLPIAWRVCYLLPLLNHVNRDVHQGNASLCRCEVIALGLCEGICRTCCRAGHKHSPFLRYEPAVDLESTHPSKRSLEPALSAAEGRGTRPLTARIDCERHCEACPSRCRVVDRHGGSASA